MSFRKVNIIILVLAVALFLLVLHHNFLGLSSLLRNEVTDSGIVGPQPIDFVPNALRYAVDGRQEEIPVVIAATEDRLGGHRSHKQHSAQHSLQCDFLHCYPQQYSRPSPVLAQQ